MADIAARRASGGGSLNEELRRRIEQLGGHADFGDAAICDAFSEVLAAFEPPGFTLVPIPDRCAIDSEDGGSIVIGGRLYAGDKFLGLLQRRLMLERGFAIHELLHLEQGARGYGVSAVCLKRCFGLYDELGLKMVLLQADMTGKWHWARVGFEFVLDKEREIVGSWTERALAALGIANLRVDGYDSAAQFARMGGARLLALESLAAAIPAERVRFRQIATENGLEMGDEIALARALMLCGPTWFGALELKGPGRVAFETYANAKILGSS